ncbi:hypothetical protein ASPZODRAFT_134622 [Penicilliopsis zonata CBS 506.65]|uniref:NADP-dependent oxidoreductase domain-containing protein n=1 Tax=Penicilliopsis zonata CBS 506.65 TaxID=1073090 RepID=A0A1L9SBI1_9EURO|nr:hypothetical protein ASPZODRAFT_134622 [Penicilliopsis zonata CBS 506.65]OJJ44540.1 hypothetical protein ASPZODRAFT_134622 [Penicilliopsis zonata CBS 506.65]
MAVAGAQYAFQTGLATGMSATEGVHSPHPKPVDPALNQAAYILPEETPVEATSRVTLKGAKEDVQVPYMCIGAWSWGDKATFKYDREKDLPRLQAAWKKLQEAGLTFVDTAQEYGDGESEKICGSLFKGMPRDSFVIQTKWAAFPDLTNVLLQAQGPVKKLRQSLENLALDHVDVYLVHGPIHINYIETVAQGLAECVHLGLAKTVGVANYSKEEMVKMADALAQHNVPLAVNQCEYSILRRHPEIYGLIHECRQRGIVFQGYASLANGRLSGKYSRFNEPQRTYRFSSYPMHMLDPTLNVLKRIAEERQVPMAAVALNFNINKGVIPVVGVRSPEQTEQNIQALGWKLSQDEIRRIENVSLEGNTTVMWQHG